MLWRGWGREEGEEGAELAFRAGLALPPTCRKMGLGTMHFDARESPGPTLAWNPGTCGFASCPAHPGVAVP